MNQKIFIKTFGCQMNEYDSNRIFDSIKKIGYEKTEKYEDANCYLLNTCHIRDKAKEKVYSEIGRVKKIFRFKKKPLVIIVGCVAQAENQEMLKREPFIDLVIGPQAYHKINDKNYNKLLEEAGILAKHEFKGGKARYEAMVESHHDHLIDIKSGEIIEFVDQEIEELQKKVAEKYGYTLVDHKLELYGVKKKSQ